MGIAGALVSNFRWSVLNHFVLDRTHDNNGFAFEEKFSEQTKTFSERALTKRDSSSSWA